MDTITTIPDLLTFNGSARPATVSLMPNEAHLIAAAPELVDAVREALAVLDLAEAYGLYEPGSLGDADVKDCRVQLRRAHHAATGRWATPLEIELGASEELTAAEYAPISKALNLSGDGGGISSVADSAGEGLRPFASDSSCQSEWGQS